MSHAFEREKALVLLRDPAGHEGGTSRALHSVLFTNGIPGDMYRTVQRADWWASAADRPQWPMEEVTLTGRDGQTRTRAVAEWAQVRWTRKPTLIHPLNGKEFDLCSLADTDIHDVKDRSRAHFERLVVRDGEAVDWRRTLLAFWRFGPELREEEDNGALGQLWPLLPADTRIPDHAIWDHLDLVSAFAGAFAAGPDEDAALLALSLGPVQSFIAAARSTSDLWAGSHLLARLSWEAAKVVCERLGPDAVLFPRLRGIPQVDVWLRDECGLPPEWFAGCDWTGRETDANPLFSAALPNRFVAIVPAGEASAIAGEIEARVRGWLQSLGVKVVERLLEAASLRNSDDPPDETVYTYRQMRDQLDGFPEVHWAAVPFSLIRPGDAKRQTGLDTTKLSEAMAPFFGTGADEPSGFLDSPAWKVLERDRSWEDGTRFFAPNPGVLYPAVYDLAERVLAAAKAVRPFAQTKQRGWRCSLTGETEWLTDDEEQLEERPYRTRQDTLWAKVVKAGSAWARAGEHLGTLPAVKRLWPTLFREEVAGVIGAGRGDVSRFVVSTHTMALAKQIMTPHHSHYYQDKTDRTSPHDSGSPNPISFLTASPGSDFVFHVRCDHRRLSRCALELAEDGRWRTLLEAAFEHVFEWLGFGAKTAVGYGAMELEPRVKEAARRKAEEEAAARKRRDEENRQREAAKAADEQRQAEQDAFDALPESRKRLIEAERALKVFRKGSRLDKARLNEVKSHGNRLADEAPGWADAAEREEAAKFLERLYEVIGWDDPGKKRAQKEKTDEEET